jgi:hypothetical protein
MAGLFRALALAGCALAAGCGGSHLHSKQDHELAKQAQAAFEKADISASLEAEYGLLAEMLAHELAIVRRHTLARRDAELVAIIGATDDASSWQFLRTRIAARERELVGEGAQVVELHQAVALLPVHERFLRDHQTDYELLRQPGDPTLACPLPRPAAKPDAAPAAPAKPGAKPDTRSEPSPAARPSYQAFVEQCTKYQAALATLRDSAAAGSEIGRINHDLAAIEELMRGVNEQVAAQQSAQRALEQQIAAARKAGTPIDIGKEIAARRDRVAKTIAPIEKHLGSARKVAARLGASDLTLDTAMARIEEQRQAVDQLVAFLIQGQGQLPERIPPEVQLSIEVARTVPAIALDLRAGRRFPRVGALVLESEHLRLEAEALAQRRARADKRRALLVQKRDALITELRYLGQARAILERLDEPTRRQPLFEAFRKNELVRRNVAEALLAYANAWTVGRVTQEEIDYMLIGQAHEGALDASAAALAQWENLIRVPLAQLVALHSAGVTSDDISRIVGHIITAAGLTAVGIGVNR